MDAYVDICKFEMETTFNLNFICQVQNSFLIGLMRATKRDGVFLVLAEGFGAAYFCQLSRY